MPKPQKRQIKFYATAEEAAWIEAHGGPTAALSVLIRDAIAREATHDATLVGVLATLTAAVERLASSPVPVNDAPARPLNAQEKTLTSLF